MSDVPIQFKTDFKVGITGDQKIFDEVSVNEITLTESLLTPSLQTRLSIQSYRHVGYVKDWDKLANEDMIIEITRPRLKELGFPHEMKVQQKVYRVSERKPKTDQIEELTITACDISLLQNASRRMSKSWKCTTPSKIVSDALKGCVGVNKLILEPSQPNRTYFAENIHPFQVVAQQADVALANNNDPSFLHYMTYEDLGTHRFESLYKMTRRNPVFEFEYKEKGNIYYTFGDPHSILGYEFPCDFDVLSDIMNGVDSDGKDQNSLMVINPFNGIHSILGGNNSQCGMGGQQMDSSFTNKGSAGQEPNCEIDVEKNKLKRAARLGLLEQDKVALRMTLAWNPNLHVGKMIKVTIPNKLVSSNGEVITTQPEYGSGLYLISALTHNLRHGGFSTTVVDCISKSVGNGGSTRG